jgi:hypothetical protein
MASREKGICVTGGSVEFTALVNKGCLPKGIADQIADVVRRMDGKRLRIKIEEFKQRRSSPQNRYYHGVCVKLVTQMFRDAGNNVNEDDVHLFLKLRVGKLLQVIVSPDGEVHKSVGSTKKLSKQEFEVYLEKIRAWAAGFDLIIPLPNEEVA